MSNSNNYSNNASNTNSRNSSSNRLNVPEARQAMDQFKMQSANEVGVNLKQGYNGDLTSREAGSVGGQMVKKICPVRIMKYERQSRTAVGHCQRVEYIAAVTI
ncbi:MAG: alpha/beta-type small acid-soluble spore protein [Oscillospiraceae bacterium]|nr:alpha/beta-type small acid-soluble spore protein [Oscillospiraceae bacterium]